MPKHPVAELRNVVLVGHGSAGKTSLADLMLFKAGETKKPGSPDDKTSVLDVDDDEKEMHHSITSHICHFEHKNARINLLDAPGLPDFLGSVIGAMRAAETAIVTINAPAGIEVNTRRTFQHAGNRGLARFIVINKCDEPKIDLPKLMQSIRDRFGTACMLMNVPVGIGPSLSGVVDAVRVPDSVPEGTVMDVAEAHQMIVETAVETNEELMARYFEDGEISPEELDAAILKAVTDGAMIPVYCTAVKSDIGVSELMDGIAAYAPSPEQLKRHVTVDGVDMEVEPKIDGPLIGQVVKTRIDPFISKVSYIRLYSGTLKKDSQVSLFGSRKGIKIGAPLLLQAEHTEPVDSAGPGSIVAVAKMDELHSGSCLGDYILPPIKFPTPMVGLAVSPKTRGDETKLSGALHKIVEEDPTFRLDRDAQTKELVMTGMSDLHLNLIQERLKRRDKLEVETKEPKIPFRETIQIDAEGSYRHKKQSGGRGQFGEVHIRMYPLPRNVNVEEWATKARFPQLKETHYDEAHNFLWVDSVVGATIPGNFMPAIEKGFKERLENGVIAGYQVQDVCVEVHFGKHHPVDSSEAAFKTAGKQAFKQVFEKAKPALLEPVVTMDITVPENNVGDVYSDMSSRGGRVQGADSAGGNFQTVHCEVPLREVTTYSRSLSSMTGGMGSFTMDFSHYEVMPPNVQQEIISKASMKEEEED